MERKKRCGIPLGIRPDFEPGIGFHRRARRRRPKYEIVTYDGDGHVLAIGPTGVGKGIGLIIPLLLSDDRTAIIVDPKGDGIAIDDHAADGQSGPLAPANPG